MITIALALLLSQADAGVRLVHHKHAQHACVFEFDAPETLKLVKDNGGPTFFVLKGKDFDFSGFESAELFSEPKHTDDIFDKKRTDVFRGVENGVVLAITTGSNGARTSGQGTEPYKSDRPTGCAFNCGGPAARQADVEQLCRSARITLKKKK